MKRAWRKIQGIAFLTAIVFVQATGLLFPLPAHAQWATLNPDIILQNLQSELSDLVEEGWDKALISAISSQLINLLIQTSNQMAANAAVWVASGGPGERPLFTTESVKDFARSTAASVAATAVDQIKAEALDSGVLQKYGVVLSDDPNYLLALREGIKQTFTGSIPEGATDAMNVVKNYEGFLATTAAGDDTQEVKTAKILAALSDSFTSNEFSNGLKLYANVLHEASSEAETAAEELIANDGFQAKTDASGISDEVTVPAGIVKAELDRAIERAQNLPFQLGSALPDSDTLLQVGSTLGSVLSNALFSELMKKMYSGLLSGIGPTVATNPFDPGSAPQFSRERAQQQFKSILAFTPLQVSDYNLLARLSSCPTSLIRNSREIYSCAIDSALASAVGRAKGGVPLTVQEAIGEGYINPNWPLIPSSDTARNQDPKCYTYGFCHSNLVKLRKARIIPVGWEMAADSRANSSSKPVTFGEVMAGFNNCNVDGEADNEHPWCHLIDPNFVLKAPDSQCRTLAYGQTLTSAGSENRSQECVDIQTCIAEDGQGNCIGGYGYCVEEKNTWRFRGDSCPAQFASCLSLTDSQGDKLDVLSNTVDYSECDESGIGCNWYATEKRLNEEGAFDWPQISNVEAQDESATAYRERIYLNGKVEPCDAGEGGCSELLPRANGLTLNLIQNSGFEVDGDGNTFPDHWLADNWGTATINRTGDAARSGLVALTPPSNGIRQHGISLNQSRFYTLSFFARNSGGGSGSVSALLKLKNAKGGQTVNLTGTSVAGNCTLVDSDGVAGADTLSLTLTTTGGYSRGTCVFTSPTFTDKTTSVDAVLEIRGTGAFIDDISLEQSESPGVYSEGYNLSAASFTYYKVAPDYLGCTGASTDVAECANFARICSANAVGCEEYTPRNGDPSVTATTIAADFCPQACIGYDTYKQEPTRYEPNGIFPLSFIPRTARTCPAQAVGCDEFTNLTSGQAEYFSYLRSCVTPEQAAANATSDNAAVYYTWEGTDESGYQLRTWRLLESNLGAGYTNYTYPSGFQETTPGNAPCTNWTPTANGISCADDANGDLIIDEASGLCDEYLDIFTNPDCREFYDAAGGIHYREWSKTVTVDASCAAYRKTDLAGLGRDDNGDSIDDGRQNCLASGGFFVEGTNDCRFYAHAEESTTCAESQNGCREYTGGRSNNSRVAFEELFEDGSLSSWQAVSAANITYSNESLAASGHSIRSQNAAFWTYIFDNGSACALPEGCPSSTGVIGGGCTVQNGKRYCGTLEDQILNGKTYTISFWARGSGTINVGLDYGSRGTSASIDQSFGSVSLGSDWRQFTLGPLDARFAGAEIAIDGTSLAFVPQGSATFFVDTVVLREGEGNITLIKDSWVTPATCDVNLEGQFTPQFHLGCQAYASSTGGTVALKSFSRLCSENDVGCQAFYATNQSQSPYAATKNGLCTTLDGNPAASPGLNCHLEQAGGAYNTNSPVLCRILTGETGCRFDADFALGETDLVDIRFEHIAFTPETEVVKADRDLYLIADGTNSCARGGAGCTELALPTLSADQSRVSEWETVYLMNTPEEYDTILCRGDQLMCEAYTVQNGGTLFFRAPENRLCEYKTDVLVSGKTYDGWFVKGTTQFCYGTGHCSESDLPCSSDAECRIGTGQCSVSALSCTNDTDCPGTESCEDVSAETCTITSPNYLVGGDFSGIWRNGDTQYDGWAGTCTPEWNGCSEFVDELDISSSEFYGNTTGQSYFFINNARLTEDDLLSGQRCKGLVSQKLGCGLFRDTGTPALTSNASATYAASVHADALFGGAPFDLTRPIDCSSSERSTITLSNGIKVDLCAQRCGYDKGAVYDITGEAPHTAQQRLTQEFLSGNPNLYGRDDLWVFGESCFAQSDCPSIESEKGDSVPGYCAPQAIVGVSAGAYVFEPVPRLTNDSNRVLKVNRDRTCSEWLTCQSSRTVWDADAGTFRTICDSVALCSEYSQAGDASFCSEWNVDDAASVFDLEKYSGRDVSWYGEEFSGYALPDQFGIQHLSQVDIAPEGICKWPSLVNPPRNMYCLEDADCITGRGTPLVSQGICEPVLENDFRLAYNAGSCEERYGESCTVGTCSDDGSACSSDNQCASNSCTTGKCFVVSTALCSNDAQCAVGQTCLSGSCVTPDGDCGLDFTCTNAGATCFPSVATKTGSCYNEQCIVSADGSRLLAGEGEAQVCRAQPEVNSPFPNSVVEEWTSFEIGVNKLRSATKDLALVPKSGLVYNTKSGFENANFCAPGEVCECSYKKLQSSTGSVSYIALDTTLETMKSALVSEFKLEDAGGGTLGVCSGGDANGAFCLIADGGKSYGCGATSVSGDAATGLGGTCYAITREDSVVGLEGYCLERDTGININGDRNTGACLTWYPVDQLAGSTDLFAKDVEAGYFVDSFVCSDLRPFLNIKPTNSTVSPSGETSACAENPSGSGAGVVSLANSHEKLPFCSRNVQCPAGFFAVLGQPTPNDSTGRSTLAYSCRFGPGASDNDCPYTCIANNAYNAEGESCKPTEPEFWGTALTGESYYDNVTRYTSRTGTPVYAWAKPADITGADPFTDYTRLITTIWSECTARGVELTSNRSDTGFGYLTFPRTAGGDEDGYYNFFPLWDSYPACKDVLQTSTSDSGYAWTDRILNPNSGFAISAQTGASVPEELRYTIGVKPTPFGSTDQHPLDVPRQDPPIAVATCNRDGARLQLPGEEANFTDCAPGEAWTSEMSGGAGTDPADPSARSFIEFFLNTFYVNIVTPPGPAWTTEPGAAIAFQKRITQLFAKIDGALKYTWSGAANTARKYSENGTFVKNMNTDVRSVGNPPKIFSVDTTRCYGSLCEEGQENQLTLNGADIGDKVGTKGFFRATLQFFAAADKNQLPLRRIIVDWGDNTTSGSETANNFYKNRRGLVEGSQSQSYCDTNQEWGMTPDSCDPYPLDYSHNYFCSDVIADGLVACVDSSGDGVYDNSPCKETNATGVLIACVYRPSVHIRDNWGWCSGVCTDGADGKAGCFENEFDSLNKPNLSNPGAECSYLRYPNVLSANNPWVYYNGVIRVEP